MQKVTEMSLSFLEVCEEAGFPTEPGGKVSLPNNQEVADRLAIAAVQSLGLETWRPGDPPVAVTATGPGPVWGWLAIAHALHGRCVRFTYAAPNATIVVWKHGV